MDLCQDKKFIDLTKDIEFFDDSKTKQLRGLMDSDKNVWVVEKNTAGGSYGVVYFFKSHNKEYCDIAVKTFQDRTEAADEILTMTLFNKFKCKNFMRCGGIENGNSFNVVMEKMDGDMISLNYKKIDNPEKLYQQFVNFLISGYRCAMKRDMYYTDIKLENVGFKMCSDGYRFCFLDYGSFSYIDANSFPATYWINIENATEGRFSMDLTVIYGTIITLLKTKMLMNNIKGAAELSKKVSILRSAKKYPKTNLLTKKYFEDIRKTYYNYFKKEDEDVEVLMDCLERLTVEEYSVSTFLDVLEYHM
jgi:hypothetical protein